MELSDLLRHVEEAIYTDESTLFRPGSDRSGLIRKIEGLFDTYQRSTYSGPFSMDPDKAYMEHVRRFHHIEDMPGADTSETPMEQESRYSDIHAVHTP